MKLIFLLSLLVSNAWAKPLVLISYFDPFNHASFNNSQVVAQALMTRLNSENSSVEVKLCSLNTIYDKAFAQTEDCLKALTERPVLVIALGESTCELKIETMMRNNDKSHGPDNAGNERRNTRIVQEGPDVLGMRYPLPEMYCALSSIERKQVDVSNNAGGFVCNNTGYQMSYHYADIQYGFIHVPANNCSNLKIKTDLAVGFLEKMIIQGVRYLSSETPDPELPHSSNEIRLATRREEVKNLRKLYENKDACLKEYLNRAKSENERGFFSGLMN
jgi:pyrrolidone-carboxylate peptidase